MDGGRSDLFSSFGGGAAEFNEAPMPMIGGDFDDTPFGAHNNPYQPLGTSLDGFFGAAMMDMPAGGFLEGAGAAGSGALQQPAVVSLMSAHNAAATLSGEAATATLLKQVVEFRKTHDMQLEQYFKRQKEVILGNIAGEADTLKRTLDGLMATLKVEADRVQHALRTVLLSASDLHQFTTLQEFFVVQDARLRLAQVELAQFSGLRVGDPTAALLIVQQPFPCVFTKGKSVEDGQLLVRLVLAPAATGKTLGPCEALMVLDPIIEAKQSGKKKTGPNAGPITNIKATFNNKGVAQLAPKFEMGTRKLPVQMQFRVNVQLGGRAGPIMSEMSRSLIVITNECQWEGSEGLLLQDTIFAHKVHDVPWAHFANVIQRHFLVVTRQDPESASRALSRPELTYFLQNLLGGKQVVSKKDFGGFWDWYGKCLQALRYQRHIGQLWNAGILLGFINRQDVNAALHGHEPGTFLIRFSERHAGQFAIAYVGYEMPRQVKHYLVQPTDTASAKKTLPDFLAECHQFQKLLQIQNGADGIARLVPCSKDDALNGFYSRIDRLDPGPGYDQLVKGPM